MSVFLLGASIMNMEDIKRRWNITKKHIRFLSISWVQIIRIHKLLTEIYNTWKAEYRTTSKISNHTWIYSYWLEECFPKKEAIIKWPSTVSNPTIGGHFSWVNGHSHYIRNFCDIVIFKKIGGKGNAVRALIRKSEVVKEPK